MIGIVSATRYTIDKARQKNTDYYFAQSVFWCLVFSIPFILIGIICPDRFLGLLGADQGLVSLGTGYLKLVLIATPFLCAITHHHRTITEFSKNNCPNH